MDALRKVVRNKTGRKVRAERPGMLNEVIFGFYLP